MQFNEGVEVKDMASVSSLGIGSGILKPELLEDILAAERKATELRLTQCRNSQSLRFG